MYLDDRYGHRARRDTRVLVQARVDDESGKHDDDYDDIRRDGRRCVRHDDHHDTLRDVRHDGHHDEYDARHELVHDDELALSQGARLLGRVVGRQSTQCHHGVHCVHLHSRSHVQLHVRLHVRSLHRLGRVAVC